MSKSMRNKAVEWSLTVWIEIYFEESNLIEVIKFKVDPTQFSQEKINLFYLLALFLSSVYLSLH